MKALIEILQETNGWVSAADVNRKCGIGNGTETEEVEEFYSQLRNLINERKVEVERRGDMDWLKFNRTKAA